MTELGMECVFPLWGLNTARLAQEMLEAGFQIRLACVDLKKLPASFSGRVFDANLLKDLPTGIDPCGENGEFHTFVHGGPVFKNPIPITPGETVEREGYAFTDFLIKQ
jgi:diphthamide synthase (EF-2-diphthine--ammonia ligase)